MKNFKFLLLAAAVLSACTENPSLSIDGPDAEEEFSHEMIILGEQLKDPYAVDNMTKALNAVYPASRGRGHLEATDYYVRFLPNDAAEMQALLDMGLQLLDHPLDYRIVRDGDWYHDPDIPEDNITWQYAVVPVSFEFPTNIRYERLEDCYLSEHDAATKSDGIDWLAVEREAYRLSGNEDYLSPETKSDELFFPEGRITIMDPEHSSEPIGVKGVRVCCNSFVKVATAYTDENGNYKINRSYSSNIHYRLMFRNTKGFNQGLNLVLIPASVSTLGKHPAAGWSVTIDNTSDYYLFIRSVVNNAGYDYYKACEESGGAIPLPPKDLRIWNLPLFRNNFNVMMHHGVLLETFSPLHNLLGIYTIVAKLVQPDVFLGMHECASYNDAYARALLAFAQAGHYSRVGKEWWHQYVMSSIGDTVMKTLGEFLGSIGTSLGSGGAGAHVDIVHTYSNYCQTILYRRNYPDSKEVFGDEIYSPQMLLYLDERGLGLEQIAPLFTSDVTSYGVLKQKLLSYYPQFKNVIVEAFARYEK